MVICLCFICVSFRSFDWCVLCQDLISIHYYRVNCNTCFWWSSAQCCQWWDCFHYPLFAIFPFSWEPVCGKHVQMIKQKCVVLKFWVTVDVALTAYGSDPSLSRNTSVFPWHTRSTYTRRIVHYSLATFTQKKGSLSLRRHDFYADPATRFPTLSSRFDK